MVDPGRDLERGSLRVLLLRSLDARLHRPHLAHPAGVLIDPALDRSGITSGPVRAGSGPVRVDSRPVRVDSRPVRIDSRPVRVSSPPLFPTSHHLMRLRTRHAWCAATANGAKPGKSINGARSMRDLGGRWWRRVQVGPFRPTPSAQVPARRRFGT
ncbi:hypothetical protein MLP_46810 [Microlunatus phosphovorus NM-1]|uniref:Uncharacterized protein n=1 Tax=Microlunatus phosphovorus (strain ATCC 700054 / DSM 10555 / JCM 9379 / NBRC 101784 / NCIMB 13414 / VKM Ac-1990 / NM-1) TaxID=1032480 RepID=F5XEE7_MICPN|nr:hypothetical protein MLP_46810 [Microlunatus phosphovorus NM-1]